MARVTVKPFVSVRDIFGEGEVKLKAEESTIGGLLKELSKTQGEKFKKQVVIDEGKGSVKFYRIVVNGRQYNDLSTQLNDGDMVEFYPAMAGG
jgi:MoaD family protein